MVSIMDIRQSSRRPLSRKSVQLIILIALLFCFSMYLYSHKYPWQASPDEKAYLAWSFNISHFGQYTNIHGSPIIHVPPVHCYSIALSFKLCGISVNSAQLVSIFFAALCSPLAFFMGKHFYNDTVGIISGIFAATSSMLWLHSSRVLSETELTFFISLSIIFLYLTLEKGTRKYALLLGISLGVGYLVKELAIFIFPLALLILIEKQYTLRTRIEHFLMCTTTCALIVLPWYYYISRELESASVLAAKGGAVGGFFTTWGLRGWSEVADILTFDGMLSTVVLVVLYSAVILAVYRCIRQKGLADKVLLLALIFLIIPFIFNTYMPVRVRRLVPLVIPLYVLGARALTELYERMKKVDIAAKKVIPASFILIIVVLSYLNMNIDLEGWEYFEFSSLSQESETDYIYKTVFLNDCNLFSSQYSTDEIVGSVYAALFYFHTQGAYTCYILSMEDRSDVGSSPLVYIYNEEKVMTEKGFLEQVYHNHITVLCLLAKVNAAQLVMYLRSHPDIFCEKTGGGYSITFVFEVDREELKKYIESLEKSS
jgi:4-amino-4-deoxy-L-arabinose transferase-like glycosyltransferase